MTAKQLERAAYTAGHAVLPAKVSAPQRETLEPGAYSLLSV